MVFKKFGMDYLVRLERGEEIAASLKAFCKEEGIKLGSISGIGAVSKATIGVFQVSEQKYYPASFEEEMEVASLNGNVTAMNGETYLHLHVVFGKNGGEAVAGHLTEAVISATAEIVIHTVDGEVDRFHDDEVGINLLKL